MIGDSSMSENTSEDTINAENMNAEAVYKEFGLKPLKRVNISKLKPWATIRRKCTDETLHSLHGKTIERIDEYSIEEGVCSSICLSIMFTDGTAVTLTSRDSETYCSWIDVEMIQL